MMLGEQLSEGSVAREKKGERRMLIAEKVAKASGSNDKDRVDEADGADASEVTDVASDDEREALEPTYAAPVSKAAINAAVEDINALHEANTLQFALGVGKIVVDRLFEGRANEALRRGRKEQSLEQLAQHRDLPIGKRQLYVAVAAYEMLNRIGMLEIVASRLLTYTHIRTLLPAPAHDHERLVAETIERGWTVKQLEAEVAKVAPKHRGGRPRISPILRAAKAAKVSLEALVAALDSGGDMTAAEERKAYSAVTRIFALTKMVARRHPWRGPNA